MKSIIIALFVFLFICQGFCGQRDSTSNKSIQIISNAQKEINDCIIKLNTKLFETDKRILSISDSIYKRNHEIARSFLKDSQWFASMVLTILIFISGLLGGFVIHKNYKVEQLVKETERETLEFKKALEDWRDKLEGKVNQVYAHADERLKRYNKDLEESAEKNFIECDNRANTKLAELEKHVTSNFI